LGDGDSGEAGGQQVLRQLGGLAAARVGRDDDGGVGADGLQKKGEAGVIAGVALVRRLRLRQGGWPLPGLVAQYS
jgi:hypothetical protein